MSATDYKKELFKTMVVLGESHVAGACAPDTSKCWVSVLAGLISSYQGVDVLCHNKGIGANSISPRSPGYPASRKPSATERLDRDVLSLKPDLFIASYGLNDMRSGMPLQDFLTDLESIVLKVRRHCNPVIVLTTVYYMTRYDLYPPYDRGSVRDTELYNRGIRELAAKCDCILADIWEAEGQADWLIHPDTVHANELGHRLIANRVFEAIATHCSGIAARVTADLETAYEEVRRTMDQRQRPQDYNGGRDY